MKPQQMVVPLRYMHLQAISRKMQMLVSRLAASARGIRVLLRSTSVSRELCSITIQLEGQEELGSLAKVFSATRALFCHRTELQQDLTVPDPATCFRCMACVTLDMNGRPQSVPV
jgi:hypothetical protein